MELYHLCDFAQIFAQQIEDYEDLPKIKKENIEAIIVSYLNHYAQCYHIPLSLYRSDLHEKGTIMNGKLSGRYENELLKLNNFIQKFIEANYLDLINSKYSVNTQIEKKLILTSNDVKKVLDIFLLEYKKYIPEPTYF